MQREERKYENRVMEKVSNEITIKQVEISTYVIELEQLNINANTLFVKLCDDIPSYYKSIRDIIDKIDANL